MMSTDMINGKSPPRIRLVVIDNHAPVRHGLAIFMKSNSDLELVGEGSSVKEALALCAEVKPDVVLMELMPITAGIIATYEISRLYPNTKVLVLTGFSNQQLIKDVLEDVLKAGAIGFLLKKISASALASAIRAAHHGISTYSPELLDMLITKSVRKPHSVSQTSQPSA